MTVAEVRTQEMWEQESAQMWEDQNPTQPIELLSNEQRIDAYAHIISATSLFDHELDFLLKAKKIVEDTPQGDKLGSICSQFEDLLVDLRIVGNEIWKRRKIDE